MMRVLIILLIILSYYYSLGEIFPPLDAAVTMHLVTHGHGSFTMEIDHYTAV
jgi:hypothetical protein